MLKSHMDAFENKLLATSRIPANSGHSLHKGTPREHFITEFLQDHLPSNVAIGNGEIIDSNSQPAQQRNQYDIVIYNRSFPKLDFGGGISGFLIESVIATIEVKSTLTQKEFGNAAKAAFNSKQLQSNTISVMQIGYSPPKLLNLIVSYDGPANMRTVHGWISPEYQKHQIPYSRLPSDHSRQSTPSDAIDAVLSLGKGFLYYDNFPVGFNVEQLRLKHPNMNWVFANSATGNLLLLFLILQNACQVVHQKLLNPFPYLSNYRAENVEIGE